MRKILIVVKNTVDSDKRTITEATNLSKSGLEVVIIGLLGTKQKKVEEINGFHVKRIKTSLPLVSAFKGRCYLPINNRIRFPIEKIFINTLYKCIVPILNWLEKRLRPIVIYVRLFKALLSEKADYYHAHFPFFLLVLAFLAAKLKGRRFVADYNNIVVLGQKAIIKDYYEQENLWGGELSEKEKDRIQAIRRLIPNDVNTVLDAGCGDGRILNTLAANYKTIGFDTSTAALRHVKAKKFIADIVNIPVAHRAFDLVVCSEVIEHLQEPVCLNAIHELARVSSKYIILAVPNNEQLSIGTSYCPKCKVKFHVNHHYHSFTVKKLLKSFSPDFTLLKYIYCGTKRLNYHPILLFFKKYIFTPLWRQIVLVDFVTEKITKKMTIEVARKAT